MDLTFLRCRCYTPSFMKVILWTSLSFLIRAVVLVAEDIPWPSLRVEPASLLYLDWTGGSLHCVADNLTSRSQINIKWIVEPSVMLRSWGVDYQPTNDDRTLQFLPLPVTLARNSSPPVHFRARCRACSRVGCLLSSPAQVTRASDWVEFPLVDHAFTHLGDAAVFHCRMSEKATLIYQHWGWLVNGVQLTQQSSVLQGVLLLDNRTLVLPEARGQVLNYKFQCIIKNLVSSQEIHSSVAIAHIIPENEALQLSSAKLYTVHAYYGDRVVLTCDGYNFYKKIDVKWIKSNIVISTSRPSISMDAVSEQDQGVYSCIISSNSSNVNISTVLKATNRPRAEITAEKWTFRRGETLQLLCECRDCERGWVWYKNGLRISDGSGRLDIRQARDSDGGYYQCATRFLGLEIMRGSLLTYHDQAPLLVFTSHPIQNVSIGSTLELTCCFGISSSLEVEWRDPNGPLQPSPLVSTETKVERAMHCFYLFASGMSEERKGTYSCVATNRIGKESQGFQVNVLGSRMISPWTPNLTVQMGTSVVIPCTHSYQTTANVIWMKENRAFTNTSLSYVTVGGVLTFLRVDLSDAGMYNCVLETEDSKSYSAQMVLDVVDLELTAVGLPTTEHSTVVFSCLSKGSLRRPVLGWSWQGSPVGRFNWTRVLHTMPTYTTMLVEDVSLRHSGRVSCFGMFGTFQLERHFDLLYTEAPKFLQDPTSLVVMEGSSLVVDCKVSGYPPPVISWFQSTPYLERQIHPTGRIMLLPNNSVVFAKVEVTDQGTYRCLASNPRGEASRIFIIEVDAPATVLSLPRTVHVENGATWNFSCSAYGTGPISFDIYQGDMAPRGTDLCRKVSCLSVTEKMTSRVDMVRVSLQLSNVTRLNSGVYYCTAVNQFSTSTSSVELVVMSIPSAPTLLLKSVSATSILVVPHIDDPGNVPVTHFHVDLVNSSVSSPSALAVVYDGTVLQISGLFPDSWYQITAAAANQLGRGPNSLPLEFLTKEMAPGAPPQKFLASSLTSTSIQLSWEPPQSRYRNGKLIGFRLFYHPTSFPLILDSPLAIPLVNSCTIDKLSKYTSYTFFLHAINSAGIGPPANISAFTLEDVPQAPPMDLKLDYQSNTTLDVRWAPVPSQYMNGIVHHYIVVVNADATAGPRSQVARTNLTSLHIQSLTPGTLYTIKVAAATIAGLGPFSFPLAVVTSKGVPADPRLLYAVQSGPSRALVIWIPAGGLHSHILQYRVYYRKAMSDDQMWSLDVPGGSSQAELVNLENGSVYSIWVTAHTAVGEGTPSHVMNITMATRVPAAIVHSPKFKVAVIGRDALLPCIVSGSPTPTVVWSRENHPPDSRWEHVGNHSLLIRACTPADAGVYTCSAANEAGQDASHTEFSVIAMLEPPVNLSVQLMEKEKTMNLSWASPYPLGDAKLNSYLLTFRTDASDLPTLELIVNRTWTVLDVMEEKFRLSLSTRLDSEIFSQRNTYTVHINDGVAVLETYLPEVEVARKAVAVSSSTVAMVVLFILLVVVLVSVSIWKLHLLSGWLVKFRNSLSRRLDRKRPPSVYQNPYENPDYGWPWFSSSRFRPSLASSLQMSPESALLRHSYIDPNGAVDVPTVLCRPPHSTNNPCTDGSNGDLRTLFKLLRPPSTSPPSSIDSVSLRSCFSSGVSPAPLANLGPSPDAVEGSDAGSVEQNLLDATGLSSIDPDPTEVTFVSSTIRSSNSR